MKEYSKLTDNQRFEIIKRGGFFLNGRYFQQYVYAGRLKDCKQFCKDNRYLEDKYYRYLIWRYKSMFFVTYGNN